jgi:hypothetical protein
LLLIDKPFKRLVSMRQNAVQSPSMLPFEFLNPPLMKG